MPLRFSRATLAFGRASENSFGARLNQVLGRNQRRARRRARARAISALILFPFIFNGFVVRTRPWKFPATVDAIRLQGVVCQRSADSSVAVRQVGSAQAGTKCFAGYARDDCGRVGDLVDSSSGAAQSAAG